MTAATWIWRSTLPMVRSLSPWRRVATGGALLKDAPGTESLNARITRVGN